MSFDPLAWLDVEREQLERQSLWRTTRARGGPQGPTIEIAGRSLANFGSNDYLSLAADARVREAAASACREVGWGAGASPLVTGRSEAQRELEERLAAFEGTEAAIVFPTGFAANLGTIGALVERGDAVLSDELNHASLVDGCRLSRAETHIYRHGDCEHLAKLLQETAAAKRRLIVTDSLFSMDGDAAPLADLARLAERHGAMLLVDEAHATGVFGKRGRGMCEALGVERGVAVRVGTLSKALGSVGGFVAGSRSLIDWLANRARPYVFSTALPAAACAAGRMVIDLVESEPERRERLLGAAAALRERLTKEGWNVGASTSQIIPLVIGDPGATMRLADALLESGMLVPGIRPPSVPENKSLLRISLTGGHTPAMIDQLLAALRAARNLCAS